jgi:hypothetical protein
MEILSRYKVNKTLADSGKATDKYKNSELLQEGTGPRANHAVDATASFVR